MNKKGKIALGGGLLLLGALTLSGCTASFCSAKDKSNILYLLDHGVTVYHDEEVANSKELKVFGESTGLYYTISIEPNSYIAKINSAAAQNGIRTPSIYYWEALDQIVLESAINEAATELGGTQNSIEWFKTQVSKASELKFTGDANDYSEDTMGLLDKYGYVKYYDSTDASKKVLWTNWTDNNEEIRSSVSEFNLSIDECPNSDYVNLYKQQMNSYINGYRSCLATKEGLYGAYGVEGYPAKISGKKWTDWKGLLEFILIWPIGAFIDALTSGFLKVGIASGFAQLISIFIATIIIRSLILLATFKQTQSNGKMTALQPEIQKIQAKYPNSNTNQYEKQRMAQEMQALYKKNKINPFGALLVMIIQFPVFICVWGAMQGSAYLSSGSVFGLRLSDSISSVIFNGTAWKTGAGPTALVLFLLMAVAQVFSMLLPQWMQKKASKKVAKLGKNPAQKQQNNNMKIFTWVMMIMIIIMGFSLASGMGVYWFVGALFSIAQTLITQSITKKKGKRK